MIFLFMLGLALLAMLPVFFSLRGETGPRGRRDAALAIHRAQLGELAEDLKQARIGSGEYDAAKLEIERRLLTADSLRDPAADGNARGLLITAIVLTPVMAFLLYLPGSTPNIPSAPHAAWMARRQAQHAQDVALIGALRAKLATLDPDSVTASEGQAYLAEMMAEDAGQLTPQSVALFRQSLAHAPAGAPWRRLVEARLAEAAASPSSP